MSTTPPEAGTEYSRGPGAPRDPSEDGARASLGHVQRRSGGVPRSVRAAILAGGTLGALLLVVAELTTLFIVSIQAGAAPLRSVATGSHHSYALVPIALLSAVLAGAVWRVGSRPALLAIGLLGLIALLIGLLGDLPDAEATGLVLRGGHYVSAGSSPSTGLYLETLGAVVLILTSVSGFLLIGPPARRASARPPRDGTS